MQASCMRAQVCVCQAGHSTSGLRRRTKAHICARPNSMPATLATATAAAAAAKGRGDNEQQVAEPAGAPIELAVAAAGAGGGQLFG